MRNTYFHIIISKPVIFFNLLTLLFIQSLMADKQVDESKFENISIPQGLSNGSVTSIIQDRYGFLWIGTDDGLNRYDGYSFKIFKNVPGNPQSLVHNGIWGIAEDSQGNLWVGTFGGASFYDRQNNSFENYDIEEMIEDYSSSNPQMVSIFVDSNDDVWIGSVGAGILKYNRSKNEFEKIEISTDNKIDLSEYHVVFPIHETDGRLFAGDLRYGLIEYDRQDSLFRTVEINTKNQALDFSNRKERISHLFTDQNNQLWIITEFGVYKLDLKTHHIHEVQKYKTHDIFHLWRMYTGLTQDHAGNIWIGKDARGLYQFDGISGDYNQIKFGNEYENKPHTYTQMIRTMFTDNTGIIWIGTMLAGLYKFDPASEPFIHHTTDPDNQNSISSNEAFGLEESKLYPNTIYVGTRGGGLNKYNPETAKFSKLDLKFDSDIFGGSVRCLLEDEDGSLYVGTWGDGLVKYAQRTGTTLISKYDTTNNASLPNDLVRVLERDAKGKIWIGTNYGLAIYNPDDETIQRIDNDVFKEYPQPLLDFIKDHQKEKDRLASHLSVGSNKDLTQTFRIERPRRYLVVSVGEIVDDSVYADYGWIEDEAGQTIWSARTPGYHYFLNGAEKNRIVADILQLKPGKYQLKYKSDDSHAFGDWNAEQPIDSTLWGIQILKINSNEQTMVSGNLRQAQNQPLISGVNIRSIVSSKKNNNIVWIGTDAAGLDKYEINSGKVTNYRQDNNNSNSVSNNSIQYIHETDEGILWLATNYGLNRFDPVKEEFTVYTEEDGLPTNYIASILQDDNDVLWLATRNGLSRMTLDNGRASFVNYDAKDGLGGSDFIAQVALKASDGRLFFGGDHGLNEFFPGRMNTTPPELLLTDLKIGNKSVTIMGDDTPVKSTIFEVDELSLNHEQNDLTFEYAALHFSRAEKNQYGHFLEGYDKEWTYDNRRFATYTNLDPGEYVFHVRGSNSDGIWSEKSLQLAITIDPPWHGTWWAYTLFAFAFISLLYGVRSVEIARREQKARITESELRAQAAEAQSKIIQTENERKSKELEEARQLQLSMLPKQLPQLPNLDIAVYMQTATEVGGDYYDFHVGLDGTLTVVIGDATGHGMKAGTIVTASKSLFSTHAANPDILFTFSEMTRCLKQMDLHLLSMCMTIMKVQNDKMVLSSAGMPPALIYRDKSKKVEEMLVKGMPLGTFDDFPYELRDTTLAPGDTILMMSDGLPELFNRNKEMFGYERVLDVFSENADSSAEDIISSLKSAGSDWVDNDDPQDDVTFVVLKVK